MDAISAQSAEIQRKLAQETAEKQRLQRDLRVLVNKYEELRGEMERERARVETETRARTLRLTLQRDFDGLKIADVVRDAAAIAGDISEDEELLKIVEVRFLAWGCRGWLGGL